jgi:hypothetical protein
MFTTLGIRSREAPIAIFAAQKELILQSKAVDTGETRLR